MFRKLVVSIAIAVACFMEAQGVRAETYTIYLPVISAPDMSIQVWHDGSFLWDSEAGLIAGCLPYAPFQEIAEKNFPTDLESAACGVPTPGLTIFENGTGTLSLETDSGSTFIIGCIIKNFGCIN